MQTMSARWSRKTELLQHGRVRGCNSTAATAAASAIVTAAAATTAATTAAAASATSGVDGLRAGVVRLCLRHLVIEMRFDLGKAGDGYADKALTKCRLLGFFRESVLVLS